MRISIAVLIFLFSTIFFAKMCHSYDLFELLVKGSNLNTQNVIPSPASSNSDDDDDDCVVTEGYVSLGDTCDGDMMSGNPSDRCSILKGNPSCCATGLYCINSVCVVDNNGAACSTKAPFTDFCYPDVTAYIAGYPGNESPISCVNGFCKYLGTPGDSCTQNSDCYAVPCSGGKCTGLSVGALCNSTGQQEHQQQCAFGFYCSFAKFPASCQQLASLNGSCQNVNCAPGLYCDSTTDLCVSSFTMPSGESCNSEDQCKVGYVCSNRRCTPATPSVIHCDNVNECVSGSSCSCNPATGSNICSGSSYVYDPCTQERSDYYGCLVTNQCSQISNQATSCSYSFCSSQMNSLTKCLWATGKGIYGSSIYCVGGFATWKLIVSIVVPVVAVVLIVIIIVVLFVSCRKKKDYDQI